MISRSLQFLLLVLTLVGCGNGSNKSNFQHAGGNFTYAVDNEPATFIARNITDIYSSKVVSQVLEGLVALDPKTLEPEPRLAKEVEVSDDGLTYTFVLRSGVYFHPHRTIGEKKKLTIEDVLYTFELICKKEGEESSVGYKSIFENRVKGANEYHTGEAENISGIIVEGDKITIELTHRDETFLAKLASPNASIISKEVVENNSEGDLIGTGPFKFEGYSSNDEDQSIITLIRNSNYYKQDKEGNKLPYLDSVTFIVEQKPLEQLTMFEEGKSCLIEGLPPSRITSMLDGKMSEFNANPPKLYLRRKPLLGTQYYYFNMNSPKFKDVRVRKALNYAVNRNDIIRNILNNQAYGPGQAGIVPPAAFNGYNSKSVKNSAYSYNPNKARKLLAEAGYPNGEGFPTLNLKFNFGGIHSGVADEFARQMKKTLNINVNLDGMEFEDKLRDERSGKGDIFRTSWYADYFSPESFLMKAYGKNVPEDSSELSLINESRYQNDKFDAVFEAACNTVKISDRYAKFSEAEQILMQDAPFIVLWYEESIILTYSKVRNLELNSLNHYDLTSVYLKEWTKKEYEASRKK